LTGGALADYRHDPTCMKRQGRSRGDLFRRASVTWTAGALCLAAVAGCGSSGAVSTGAPQKPAGAHAPATFGHSVRLERVSGKVLVARPTVPGGFVALSASREVPLGTLVDTTAGNVRLTSATPPPTRYQSGQFHGGIFQIRQDRAERGLINLVIRDNVSRQSGCPHGSAGGIAPSPRILGLLRGNASGRFRTTGRFAAATVLGTEWGVRDRCDGTLTVVTRGVVVVRDLQRQKNIIVHAGQSYLASAS
jgi:hypothetical protein